MTKDTDFGEVLGTREFSWQDASNNTILAYVDISLPIRAVSEQENHTINYYCNVKLRGLGDDAIHVANGADELQAIYMALVLAGSKVATCGLADELDWSAVPNFGFPEAISLPADGDCGCK